MNQNSKDANLLLARLDRLSGWPYPWYILAIIGASYFFCFYDVIIIGTTLPKIILDFGISQQESTWAVTVNLIGYIFGAFLIGQISDRFGRRLSLFVSITFYSVGTFLCACSYQMPTFLVWRFVTGMGIGSELACAVSYISELSPSVSRGRNATLTSSCGFLAFAVTPFISLFILDYLHLSWRLLFVIGGLCGVITFFLRYYLPHSPRWLVQNKLLDEAEEIIVQAEVYAQKKPENLTLSLPLNDFPPTTSNGNFWELFYPPHLKNLLLILAIFIFFYIGNFGWLTLNVTLLTDVGYTFANSVLFICLSSLGFIAGSIFAICFADKIERKWLCTLIACTWAISLFVIGFFPWHKVIMVFGFIACASISAIMPLMYTYAAENFPTVIRATAVALTDGLGHIGGAFSGQMIFAAYYYFHTNESSFAAAFSVMGISGVITAILFAFGDRMTKQRLQ